MSSQPPKKKNESSGPAPKQPSAGRRVKKSAQKINTEQEDESEFLGGGRFLLFTVVPSWVISLLTHVSLILVAAFFALPRPAAKSISFEGAPPSDSPVESAGASRSYILSTTQPPSAFDRKETHRHIPVSPFRGARYGQDTPDLGHCCRRCCSR